MSQFSSVQSLSCIQLFVTPWITAHEASLSITNSQSSPKLMCIWVSDAIQPSHPLFSPSPPAPKPSWHQGLFQWVNSAWGGQNIGVSATASVLPMNTQDWSPLGWTGWIFLQSKGLSRVFSNTTVQKHQFFEAQLSSALLTMSKPLTVWSTINCGKFWKRWEYQTTWPASWETYMQVRKQQLELDMEQQTGSK